MGYMHIDNLYKYPNIFLFKDVYCLEKIHGTSAHVSWKNGELKFFAGGESHEKFVKLFDQEKLKAAFTEHFGIEPVTIFGEAYGGKQQKMADTYGPGLRFIVFDVKVGDTWLGVSNAYDVAKKLGLEFVYYCIVPATLEALTAERDRPSVQADRNGIAEPKQREGIVIRPLIELRQNNGNRIVAKYKTENFRETKTPREVDPDKLKVLEAADAIATEWVTPMRLDHVLQKIPGATDVKHTGQVIKAMQEDVEREAGSEVVWSKEASRAVGRAAAKMFKARVFFITEAKKS